VKKLFAMVTLVMVGLFAGSAQAADDVVYEERVLGDPNAPVTVIEYASFTCPHCARFHNDVMPQIKKEFVDTGKVKFIFRDFPFDRAGATAAMLARCVAPSRFNGYVDMLFKQQAKWARAENPLAVLTNLSKLAGLSEEKVNTCLRNEKLLDEIVAIRKEAMDTYGFNATPSFLINGEKVIGGGDFTRFKSIIEDKL